MKICSAVSFPARISGWPWRERNKDALSLSPSWGGSLRTLKLGRSPFIRVKARPPFGSSKTSLVLSAKHNGHHLKLQELVPNHSRLTMLTGVIHLANQTSHGTVRETTTSPHYRCKFHQCVFAKVQPFDTLLCFGKWHDCWGAQGNSCLWWRISQKIIRAWTTAIK